ncbi:helix-turn-helix transcriptional regulator [Yoonia sediminilitoris]|uniref:Regulatory LuxR family protein n=1 Tax=Yoonia sediminilitoris TaxID=1286148 RepID=A0A2T6KPX3_9RHOB|nr:LuxR C-terminal-related transcriptional regulator [Yoonia sediminilitoris]PUB18611.1 regulatory LuxR family protein [Yoonia sediminilitoris]RCW98779.1 regulatory LuxR family protein [Yoonia sediminilitoris]
MIGRWYILAIVLVQLVCAIFFLSRILSSILGFAPFQWQVYELIEIGAALGLVLGAVLGMMALRKTIARNSRVEDQLRLASGAFMDVVEERFTEWALTPAERDVALFAIKGMSTTEIACLRDVSEGTVKAQTNAIYRKAGVSGRTQLLSLFVEDLIGDALAAPQI